MSCISRIESKKNADQPQNEKKKRNTKKRKGAKSKKRSIWLEENLTEAFAMKKTKRKREK
jgi:hypothetical protein